MVIIDILILTGGLLCGYLIYAKGVSDGIKLEKGHKVAILPNPIKKMQERKITKENDKHEKEMATAIENMMNYTGDKQKVGG